MNGPPVSVPFRYRMRAAAGALLRWRIRRERQRLLAAAFRDSRQLQRAVLSDLLRLNAGTRLCLEFGLSPSMSASHFRQRMPVTTYEDIRPYVDRVAAGDHAAMLGEHNRLLMFARTSGTTSASKLIPVTTRFLNDYRRGWQVWGIGTYTEHPLLQKLNLAQVASSHRQSRTADGTPCGNISGLVAAMQNPIVRSLYSVPAAVADIRCPELRQFTIVRLAATDPWIGAVITANPSSVLQMADLAATRGEALLRAIHDGGLQSSEIPDELRERLRPYLAPNPQRARQLQSRMSERGGLRLADCWPVLQFLGVWCGGSAAAYLPALKQHFPGVAIRDHGLHASEGRMTLPLRDHSSSGVLEVFTHYFEFLPVAEAASSQPVTLEAHELTVGADYLILLTTSSGLYRYNMQDVVRCTGWYGSTPLLEFRHKAAHMSSITGEKLAESQVVAAVQAACLREAIELRQFTLAPVWGHPPGYALNILASGNQPVTVDQVRIDRLNRLAHAVDLELARQNDEYREKRASGRLAEVRVRELPASAWRQFTQTRQQRSGGSVEQYKHPCLLPDPRFEGLFDRDAGLADSTATGKQALEFSEFVSQTSPSGLPSPVV
jgi:hypothetical protein